MLHQKVLVLDFGGQYNQLIARRVRDLGVYCELLPSDLSLEQIKAFSPIGIIFTGGPNSVYDEAAPRISPAVFSLGVPVLGICYGAQLIAHTLGGKVVHANKSEYGKREFSFVKQNPLSSNIPERSVCWMSHTDLVQDLPSGFETLASTQSCENALFGCEEKKIYGVQFHPEVVHSEYGNKLLENFLYLVCGAKGDWTMKNFAQEQVEKLRARIGSGKVLCAMSGGVDSAVAATLVHRAVGENLTCVFVDHGLHRKDEPEEVMRVFKEGMGMNLIKADAGERPREEAAHHRRSLHPRIRRGGEENRQGRLFGAGDHLSRRHRERKGEERRHQEPPQRGRAARRHRLQGDRRAFARPF